MARKLMVLGTASHVGKSTVVAALCRILRQEGISVAPFKSQNMSLNSYVCRDGAEIGRAQAAQAEAAGIEPEVHMNPILLKPSGGRGIQVVLQGRVYATMSANEYYEQKAFFLEQSLNSFHRLASRFEVIVLEGAGSTMEVNLRDRDIVNLAFAQAVGASAVLVADIDRGGVFGSIVGTLDLMHPSERSLIKGFIINRFRGEAALFEPGRVFLEERTSIQCLGILPHIESLRVDDEDSVSLEGRIRQTGEFRIGVIKLPHISNHTDFDRLDTISGVSVEYIDQPTSHFDLVIVPGTKNTISDLDWLTVRGFRSLLANTLEGHGWVLGICGGYQMLGESVSDPFAVEMGGKAKGLGLLPMQTEMAIEKVTVQSSGHSFLGVTVNGYEVHMGRSAYIGAVEPFITRLDGTADGAVAGHVAGTYFHGLFDNPEFTRRFLSIVARDRKLLWQPEFTDFDKDHEYDRLAAVAREHLDISQIYELLT